MFMNKEQFKAIASILRRMCRRHDMVHSHHDIKMFDFSHHLLLIAAVVILRDTHIRKCFVLRFTNYIYEQYGAFKLGMLG